MGRLMVLRPVQLVLLDGIGALISGILLLGLIAPHPTLFGVPAWMARGLALPAFLLAGFGLGSAASRMAVPVKTLRWLATGNLLYCIATLSLVIRFHNEITVPGVAYFAGEICLILLLAGAELRAARAISSSGIS